MNPHGLLKISWLTNQPRLVIVNAEEAAALGQILADQTGNPVHVEMYRSDRNTAQLIKSHRGDVVLFELSTYMSRYTAATLQTLGEAAGGWKCVIDRKVCRMFYAHELPT